MGKGLGVLLCLGAVISPAAARGQTSPSPTEGSVSKSGASADLAPYLIGVSVEEAERLGIEAIDRLDATGDSEIEDARSLLERLKNVVEFIESSRPGHPSLDYLRGRMYAFIGRESEAVEHLQRFVQTRAGRSEWRAHRVLGDLFVGQFPRLARRSYEAAAALTEHEPTVLIGLSQCAHAIGDGDEAIRFAEAAADADGRKTVRYLHNLARMLMAVKNWSEAQSVAEEALAAAERIDKPRESLSESDLQYKLLIEILRRRINETPGDAAAYVDLAKYLQDRAGNSVAAARLEALRVLARGVEEAPSPVPLAILEHYAVALAEAGRSDAAVARFEEILSRDPGNSTATKWLARLKTGDSTAGSPP